MVETTPQSELLVLSRGKWDEDKTPEEIQVAIDGFYAWYEGMVAEGRIKPGQRLGTDAMRVTRNGVIDGPFTEAREVIGGYGFIVAAGLEEAAVVASKNPCLSCGLSFEIRPVEYQRASAYAVTNETPAWRLGLD